MRVYKNCQHCGAEVTWLEPAYIFRPAPSIRCGACQQYVYARSTEVIVAQPTGRDPVFAAGLTVAPYPQRGDGINRDEA